MEKVSRKRRKERADAKRKAILIVLAEHTKEQFDKATAAGAKDSIGYALDQLKNLAVSMCKARPQEAHLVRSALLQFGRELRKPS